MQRTRRSPSDTATDTSTHNASCHFCRQNNGAKHRIKTIQSRCDASAEPQQISNSTAAAADTNPYAAATGVLINTLRIRIRKYFS